MRTLLRRVLYLAREDAREVWTFAWLERIWRDARYGVKALLREPAFALTGILTLALGVATVTTIFSAVDAELWKPLPFPRPDRLVAITSKGPGAHPVYDSISGADLRDWQAGASGFEEIAGFGLTGRRVLRLDSAEAVVVTTVTSNLFSTLGASMFAGRAFSPADEAGGRTAVISRRAWRRIFDEDPGVVGRSVILDDRPIVINGILKTADALGQDSDFYVALDSASPEFRDRRAQAITGVVGRLKPGVDAASAQSDLQAVAARLAAASPDDRAGHSVQIKDLREYYTRNNWRPLYFFLGAAAVVLILSCANVANLLLARALRRRREFAIRGALGGGGATLARQLLVEGALLALPGGAVGVLLTGWALGLFSAQLPEGYLGHGRIPVDGRVCLFALAVTSLTAIVFGLAPALFTRRINLNITLGDGGRTAGRSASHVRARHALLTTQVALTLVLLAGVGLFVRSYLLLTHVPLGFDPGGRVAVRVSLSGPRYETDAQRRGYADAAVEAVRAVGSLRDVAVASSSPLGSGPLVYFVVGERPRPAPGDEPNAILRAAGPDYFRTLGIRILNGRAFTAGDGAGAPRVAIVNEYFARSMFPNQNPIGRTIELLPRAHAPWTNRPGSLTIVGVAANVKQVGLNEIEFKDLCVPFAQAPSPGLEIVARTGIDAAAVIPALRAALAGVDRGVPVGTATTFEQRISDALREDRFNLLLISWFASVALLIAGIGIYGAVAYAVQERTREFGVRLALGARPRTIVMAAFSQAARFGLLGGSLGLAGAVALARVLGSALYLVPQEHSGLLYGVRTTDPFALGCAFAGVVAVSLAAAAIPARHVARVDPLVALRQE